MRTNERLNAWWTLAREDSPEGTTLRRRVAAINAMVFLFCGFLLAIGLRVVVLVFFAALLVALAAVLVIAAMPRVRPWLAGSVPVWRSRVRAGRAVLAPLGREVRRSSASGFASARNRTRELAHAGAAITSRLASRVTYTDPRREALRLNAAGSDYRRNGRFAEAAECHRRALDILRALDDRRAIALTESNLAIALSRAGDDYWAIGLFEEAAATLRELGDEEHEARIVANLGLAHRRRGRREEAENMLRLALTKLSPASSAYRTIEAELVRAGDGS
jgi:hypothetical protein